MSPDQATRFRDNLRTRVMTAQLALMMRQSEVWKTETEAVVKAIESRYDESSPLTRKALRLARGMADATIDARLPTVDNTLHALAGLREEQARRFGGPDSAAPQQQEHSESSAESQAPDADAPADESASDTPESADAQGADAPQEEAPDAGSPPPSAASEQMES